MSAFFLYLCFPLQVAALRRADPLSKESHQLSVRFIVLKIFPEWEQARGPNPSEEGERRGRIS
jgi:hypothetical protein